MVNILHKKNPQKNPVMFVEDNWQNLITFAAQQQLSKDNLW